MTNDNTRSGFVIPSTFVIRAPSLLKPRLQFCVLTYETFCGGIFETNCYLVEAPQGWILCDAPDGACDWLESRHVDVGLLLLTHGTSITSPMWQKSSDTSIARSVVTLKLR